jgi:microcystin-dependent protein
MSFLSLTNENQQLVVNYQYISPVGSIMCYAGNTNTPPTGWLFCNGSEISKTTYASLYTIIGDTYGSPLNEDNFVLPNLSDRFPIGKSNSINLGHTSGSSFVTLSTNQLPSHSHTGTTEISGTHVHTGSTSTNGQHTHGINDPGHAHTQWTINDDYNNSGANPPGFMQDSAGYKTWNNINSNTTGITINSAGDHTHSLNVDASGNHTHTFTTNTSGSGDSINILNPCISLNYLIKY